MKKALKSVSVIICLIACLFGNNLIAHASTEDMVTPYYDYAQYVSVGLGISSNGKASVSIHCSGISTSVKKITAETCIQRKVGLIWVKQDIGTTNDVWNDSKNGFALNASHSAQLNKSGDYRAKTVFHLYDSSGKSEKITAYSNVVNY